MAEHAFLLKNVGDALKLRGAVIDRFEEANLLADPTRLVPLLTFVVVGGGYSGVETAGQLLDLVDSVRGLYRRIADARFRVVLIHSGDHLLPEISEKLGKYCEETLRARGVEIILEQPRHRDDLEQSDTRRWAYLRESHRRLHRRQCRASGTDPALRREQAGERKRPDPDRTHDACAGQPGLWAAGDCAAVPQVAGGTCPPTAQFATRQGTLLGRNIARTLAGREDLEPFKFQGLGSMASIGHRTAVAEILGMQFSGFFAWWLWRTVYLAKLPGVERKLRVLIDWTLDLFFSRDISLFQPRFTKAAEDMFLEARRHRLPRWRAGLLLLSGEKRTCGVARRRGSRGADHSSRRAFWRKRIPGTPRLELHCRSRQNPLPSWR